MKRHIEILTLLAAMALATSAQAQVTIGSWQGSSSEGWIDWNYPNSGAGTPVLSSTNFSLASGAVSGYAQSLQLTKLGWNQNLAIKLEYTSGDVAALLNNQDFSLTWSVPAGTGGGYEQLWGLYINGPGIGFQQQPASEVSITGSGHTSGTGGELDFWAGSPVQTQTITWNYSSILPTLGSNPSYVEFILVSNGGGGAPGTFYFNNAELWGGPIPEPSSLAVMGLGLLAGGWFNRRRNR